MGLGYLITLVWQLSGIQPPSVNWGLLQALGAAGLIALPFIQLTTGWRFGIGLGMMAIYQLLSDRFWLEDVLIVPHNGPWGAMLILSTAMADMYHDEHLKRSAYPLVSAGMVAAGLVLTLLTPLSKDRASASYMTLSLGLSGLVFYLFHLLNKRWRIKLPVMTEWGKNPLLLYLLRYVILGFFALPSIPFWYAQAPIWLIILQI